MKPTPLVLDYLPASPWHTWPGWLLLVAGLVVSVGLAWYDHQLTEQLDSVTFRVAQLQRKATRDIPATDATTTTTPRWDLLFSALENAADESVTLLSLRPDAKSIVATGEAKDLASALDYLERLRQGSRLAHVRLTEQEVLQDQPRKPLRFTLAADWATGATP